MRHNKKILYVFIIAIIFAVGLSVLSGCSCTKPDPDSPDPDSYTVTFDGNGGTLVSGKQIQQVEKSKDATAPVYQRDGYEFDGWDKAFTNVVANITVKALWKKLYTVAFDGNGGTLTSGAQTQQVKDGTAATAPIYQRDGYRFDGWDKEFANVEANITVKALWTKLHTVTFDGYGGARSSGGGDLVQIIADGEDIEDAPVFQKEGYNLTWSQSLENITEDVTITARWEWKGGTESTELERFWEVSKESMFEIWGAIGVKEETVECLEKFEIKVGESMVDRGIKAYVFASEHLLALECHYVDLIQTLADLKGGLAAEGTGRSETDDFEVLPNTNIIVFQGHSIPLILSNDLKKSNDEYYNKAESILIRYLGDDSNYTIPSSVTAIGDGAFLGNEYITNITISDPVSKIGNSAFSGCNALKEVSVGGSVTNIGTQAFKDCANLELVRLQPGLKEIGYEAFKESQRIKHIILPDGLTHIGGGAFSDCSLEVIYIPESVTDIGFNLASTSVDLKIYVKAESKPDGWNTNWYTGGVEWGASKIVALRDASKDLFEELWGISKDELAINANYELDPEVGEGIAFMVPVEGGGLEPMAIEYADLAAAEAALPILEGIWVEGIEFSIIPGTYIVCMVFGGVQHIFADNYSYGGTEDTYFSLDLKVLIKYTGDNKNYEMANHVEEIAGHAFADNDKITMITLPDSITKIGQGAFGNSKIVTVIILATTPPELEKSVFDVQDPSSLAIYVPENSIDEYMVAPGWIDYADIIAVN